MDLTSEDITKEYRKRTMNSALFRVGELDLMELKNSLKELRRADRILLEELEIELDQFLDLSDELFIKVFNNILNSSKFFRRVDRENLILRPDVEQLLDQATRVVAGGKKIKTEVTRGLNRALINAIYPFSTVKARQYPRFNSPTFLDIPVTLHQLPPFFGTPIEAQLMNLSAGGVALFLKEIVPVGTLLMLNIVFPDHSQLETKVQIRHFTSQDGRHLHGFEFLGMPDYMRKKLMGIANDYLACETRIQNKEPEICQLSCAYFGWCSKLQRAQ